MAPWQEGRATEKWVAAGVGLAAGAYATWAALGWFRYGRPSPPTADQADRLLDYFMPDYEIVERHSIRVQAPAALTLLAATEQDLLQSPVIRAIFTTRELVLGATPGSTPPPRGLLAQVRALGWGLLADAQDREIVMGAVTQPWKADVVFRPLHPDEFVRFKTPGFVKIAWTLRADPVGPDASVFRTETRAVATDAASRAKFRRYWAFVSPGVWLIRSLSLGPLKRDAERRARGRRSP